LLALIAKIEKLAVLLFKEIEETCW